MTFEFNASASGDEADIAITGVIGDDFWSDEPCTADIVRSALAKTPKVSLIRAFVDTDGGDVWQGFGIYQALSEHKARVEVTIGARAQSCGSLIAMAGDTISMHESSKLLIHNPWGVRVGDADRLEAAAKDIRNLQASFVTAYAAESGMSEKDVQSLMNEDRLMDSAEALAKGFCTEVRKAPRKDRGAAAMGDQELRDSMSKLRARAMTSATALRIAAMSPPTQRQDNPPAPPVETEQQEDMAQLAVIMAALCLAEGVSDNEAVASITALRAHKTENVKLLEAIGAKSTDEALGSLKALHERAAAGDVAVAAQKKLESDTLAAKKTALIVAASTPAKSAALDPANPHAGKLTPALKGWAESVSMETLEGFLAKATPVLVGDGKTEPGIHTSGSSDLTWNGKTFAQLQPLQRASLKQENAELYNAMRENWLAAGSPEATSAK